MKINYFKGGRVMVIVMVGFVCTYQAFSQSSIITDRIEGVCLVAPPSPFKGEPLQEVSDLGAEWVAVVPFGYTILDQTKVHFDSDRQWWGERTEGVRVSIKKAHAAGLKVFLKPQVYVPGSWPGGLTYDSEEQWLAWESQYTQFIMHWVSIAQELNVDGLSIGTEFKISTTERPEYWGKLIKNIRCEYDGLLSYCANWDEYNQVTFWSQLDFIGVDAYFPLSDSKTPDVDELVTLWDMYSPEMEKISRRYDKPIVFTEYGYLSVDQAAHKTWELEAKVRQIPVNEQAQAQSIDALWTYFEKKKWWKGGLYWKWFPEMKGHEGYPERDYTFQGKLGEEVIKKHFQK